MAKPRRVEPEEWAGPAEVERWRTVPVAVAVDLNLEPGQIDPAIRPLRPPGQPGRIRAPLWMGAVRAVAGNGSRRGACGRDPARRRARHSPLPQPSRDARDVMGISREEACQSVVPGNGTACFRPVQPGGG